MACISNFACINNIAKSFLCLVKQSSPISFHGFVSGIVLVVMMVAYADCEWHPLFSD